MEDNKKTLNNMDLIISIKVMQGNPTPETQSAFINQMIHAKFLTPAVSAMKKDDSTGEDRKMYRFPHVANAEGAQYLIAFTDELELNKWQVEGEYEAILSDFRNFSSITLQNNSPYNGFVINPFNENIIVDKEIMNHINKNIKKK